MDTLKGFFLANYWRKTFFTTGTVTAFLSALGFFWLLTEISAFVVESWKTQLQSAWMYFIALSAIYTLWSRKPVLVIKERLNNTDIQIEVRISNIFSIPAAYVISTNTTFDTEVNEKIISTKSIQGAFTNHFYDNIQHLDSDIANALEYEDIASSRASNVGGKTDLYNIGAVAKIMPKKQSAYLLAISQLNKDGVAESSFEDVKIALASLWNYISSKGSYEPLAIPILGTGHGRINTPRDVVIKEIIRSFIAACSERKFTNKLTVVIAPRDYHDHALDIYEIGEFLKYVCKYTEIFSTTVGTGKATD